MADADQSNLTVLTVDLLSAYVANNTVEYGAIPDLIKSTHAALRVIDSPEQPAPEEPSYKPAVSVRKSLSSDSHIVSLIDGKPYQTLKRHLSSHGLTPAQYRERYSLPETYPMVAKAYSEARRAIAAKLGLGRRVSGAQAIVAAPAAMEVSKTAAPVKPAKPAASKAPKAVAAKAEKAASTREKAPRKATAAPAAAEIPVTETPAKTAPKTRKARASKQTASSVAAPAPAKPAARKRAPKTAEPAA